MQIKKFLQPLLLCGVMALSACAHTIVIPDHLKHCPVPDAPVIEQGVTVGDMIDYSHIQEGALDNCQKIVDELVGLTTNKWPD